MIDGYRTYIYYRSILLHFTSKTYNVFENKGKINCSFESYLKRKDNKIFDSAGKLFTSDLQAIQFIASNVAYGDKNFIYNLNDSCVDNYLLYLKRKESITNVFKEDLGKIEFELDKGETNALTFTDGNVPLSYRMYLGGEISIESIFILNKLTGFLEIEHPVFEKDFLKIKKMTGFCSFDLQKIQNVFNNFKLN